MEDAEFVIHYKLDFRKRPEDRNGRIQRIEFSYEGNLYVLVYTETE